MHADQEVGGAAAAAADEEHWLVRLHRLDEGVPVRKSPEEERRLGEEAARRYLPALLP